MQMYIQFLDKKAFHKKITEWIQKINKRVMKIYDVALSEITLRKEKVHGMEKNNKNLFR